MDIFKNRLRELRGERRQLDIALAVGISLQSYSAFENGREPSYEVLVKLSDHFDVSLDYILGRIDVKKQENALIYEKTGLGDDAIQCLEISKDINGFTSIVNDLITSRRFPEIIQNIYIYVYCSQSEDMRDGMKASFLHTIEQYEKFKEEENSPLFIELIQQLQRYIDELNTIEGTEELMLSEMRRNIERISKGIKNRILNKKTKSEE